MSLFSVSHTNGHDHSQPPGMRPPMTKSCHLYFWDML
ncbi:hypothetical protein CEXT_208291, partial [Caerostris extrusa]